MAEYTTHYNLKKPAKNENYNIDVANENNDIIDEKLYGKVDKKVGKDLSTNDFTDEYRKKLSELSNYDDSKIKKEISAIKEENKKQEQSIEEEKKKLQEYNDNAEILKEKVDLLESNLEDVKVSGENIEIDDALEYYTDNHKIYGKSVQETRELSQNTASGEKVTLTNVDPNKSIDISIDGNNRQETTTGKQLFNKDGDLSYPNNTAYTNATVLLSDGTLKSNSNANSNASRGARLAVLKANTIYTVKGKIKSMTHNVRIRIMGYSTNWRAIVEPIFTSIGDFKFTFNTSSEYSDFFLSLNGYYNDSTTITEAIFDEVMVYEGTDDIQYEKYTGGIESPNVKYPSEVEVIDGCNRFDVQEFQNQFVTSKILNDDGNEISDSTSQYSKYKIFLKANKSYYIKGAFQRLYYYDSAGNFKKRSQSVDGMDRAYTPEEDEYISFQINNNFWNTNKGSEQITEGTEEKPYLPHGCVGLKFSGKNKFNVNGNIQQLSSSDYYTRVENNKVIIPYSNGYEQSALFESINVKGGKTYTISCKLEQGIVRLAFRLYDINNNLISSTIEGAAYLDYYKGYYFRNNLIKVTFTLPENAKYLRILTINSTTTNNEETILSEIQLTEGEEEKPYEIYHEPQLIAVDLAGNSIAKINDSIKDELSIYRNDKVILGRKTNRYIFTGNENLEKNTNYSTDSMLVVQFKKNDMKVGTTNILCNYFKYSSSTIINSIRAAGDYVLFGLDKATFTDVDSFKSYLLQQYENETAVYIDYELATPQTIELPSINMPQLWEGTVNVELVSNLATNLNANYNIVPAKPSLEAESEVSSIDNVNIRICNENLAYEGWAEDFVSRINNSGRASIATKDGRKCLLYSPDAGYNDYDNKYLFKTNWKENVQYTFKFDAYLLNKNGYVNLCLQYTDGTEQELSNLKTNEWNKVNFKSKASKTIKYLRVNWRSESTYIDLDTFMVYEGTEISQFIQNQTNKLQMFLGKPLRGIKIEDKEYNGKLANYVDENGNYWACDYITDDGIHRRIKRKIFDGTENFEYDAGTDVNNENNYSSVLRFTDGASNRTDVMCNYFQNKAIYAQKDITGINLTMYYLYFSYPKTFAATQEQFKEKLKQLYENGNPLYIDYISKDEELEEFTEEEKKSWNEFKKLKTFKGKNYISSVDNIQAGIEFSYKKDNRISTQKELEKCNERLNNIENLLNTTETSSLLLDNLENDLKKEVE